METRDPGGSEAPAPDEIYEKLQARLDEWDFSTQPQDVNLALSRSIVAEALREAPNLAEGVTDIPAREWPIPLLPVLMEENENGQTVFEDNRLTIDRSKSDPGELVAKVIHKKGSGWGIEFILREEKIRLITESMQSYVDPATNFASSYYQEQPLLTRMVARLAVLAAKHAKPPRR